MTNLSHWQDDIDEALGGDFDGSLSGLCIMSLSFDFTRNGAGPHLTTSNATISSATHQASSGLLNSSSTNRPTTTTTNSINHDAHNDNSNNCFKRFKPTILANDAINDDENRLNNQNKIARQLQQLKNCLTSTSINNSITSANLLNVSATAIQGQAENQDEPEDRLSPRSSVTSCHRASVAPSITNESSRSSTVGARSPSPQSCSSVSTHSRTSSRSQSPSDMSIHSCHNTNTNNNNINNNNNNNNNETRSTPNGAHTIQHRGKNTSMHQNEPSRHGTNDNQQLSLYSAKDNVCGGSTLKESSYTTSVITTTAPMHFKSFHPFSLKQFPLSPYHQFSNSSLNHDFYDRYLSHDSHQPLQTPLIGIERTQDLLSLKLPPHGPEDLDSQKFPKEWSFDDASKQDNNQNIRASTNIVDKPREDIPDNCRANNNQQSGVKRKEPGDEAGSELQKGFPFNYKSNSNTRSNDGVNDQREPIDLNVSYEQDGCCNEDDNEEEEENNKNSIFNESMKHFNPNRVQQNACFNLRSKNDESPSHNDNQGNEAESTTNIAHQYLAQESMFGIDPSKQKFQYVLAAPISVATKLNEDTMTYLNQGQAYEIKLENTTDVAEARKGFMCSIINIGFQERHMQQAENELWQQWSQQHPNEKIFSVDMKLSYNVFGVESDGLNKYEFLWDSSKAAGVFIRINSISTEFTPKKHGGEKGVPFKLSIETFSYNSKTHDSYFISAACCQIKVFKPKGAERKIRSDRDKVSKRPPIEQEKYHRSCDHTFFKECSLASLHPMADGSLCYYRHSHGHFASKQVAPSNTNNTLPIQSQQAAAQQADEDLDQVNNTSQQNLSPENHSSVQNHRASQVSNDSETSNNNQTGTHQRSYQNEIRQIPIASKLNHSDYPSSRLMQQHSHFNRNNLENNLDPTDHNYGPQQIQLPTTEPNPSHSSELFQLQQPNSFNQMYHNNSRAITSLPGINNPQHFGMTYYGHSLSNSVQSSHIPTTSSYSSPAITTFSNTYSSHNGHTFPTPAQHHIGASKNGTLMQRNLSSEKQPLISTSNHSTSFKASNLALTSHNNNFQSYNGNHSDQCTETPSHDIKDGPPNGSYHNDIYDSHQHHNIHSTGFHSHQPFRHRSASMTTVNNHCAGYNGNQARHMDNYSGNNGASLENNINTNHWHHGSTNHSQLNSPISLYNQRPQTNGNNQNQDTHLYNSPHNYDCNQHYDSSQNSPMKNHNMSDSSSSCNSTFRNNSSVISNAPQQVHYDGSRSNFHIGQITMNSNCHEVVSWFTANRFGVFTKTFSNFSGSDLLRLSKNDLIEICGLIDGIRLFNSLHNQPIKPRRVLYVCHQSSDIFHPIYLHDLTLKELLRELSVVFNVYLQNCDNQHLEEKQVKNMGEKPLSNSSSSTDSRSSIGALSTEAGADDRYSHNEHFFNELIDSQRQRKNQALSLKPSDDLNSLSHAITIDRLLVDGITSVKIVATEQVVQILENESVWTLSTSTGNSRFVEACISACQTKRVQNK